MSYSNFKFALINMKHLLYKRKLADIATGNVVNKVVYWKIKPRGVVGMRHIVTFVHASLT